MNILCGSGYETISSHRVDVFLNNALFSMNDPKTDEIDYNMVFTWHKECFDISSNGLSNLENMIVKCLPKL